MDSRRKRGRSKIFKCFRTTAVDDCLIQTKGTEDLGKPALTYVAVGGNGKIVLFDESLEVCSYGNVARLDGRRKDSPRRRFSRVLKAVLFDISLIKKIRDGKSRKSLFRSKSSLSVNSEKIANSNSDKTSYKESSDAGHILRTNSSSSYLFSSSTTASSSLSSSCSSSMNSNSRSLSERKGSSRANSMDRKGSFAANSLEVHKQNSTKKASGFYSSTIGLCLLLISLLVLILWGRISAIFFTSIWFFFGPRWITGHDSPVDPADSPLNLADSRDMDSQEYKKRVIMEGLLDRNRNRPR